MLCSYSYSNVVFLGLVQVLSACLCIQLRRELKCQESDQIAAEAWSKHVNLM